MRLFSHRSALRAVRRRVLSVAVIMAMLSSLGMPIVASADAPTVLITAAYGSFNPTNIAAYQLNGDAVLNGGAVRLTESVGDQSGSMFWKQRVGLDADGSFSSQFAFQISDPDPYDGADGFTFCMQPGANTVVSGGGGLGYADIPNSLAVEFDTYQNEWDPDANHVGIDLNGSTTSAIVQTAPFELQSGTVGYAWVDYNGTTDSLQVRVSDTVARPESALLDYTVDLTAIFGPDVFLGFTAATGGGYEKHDILGWYFSDQLQPGGLTPDTVMYVMGPASINAVADPADIGPGETTSVTFTVTGQDGTPSVGETLTVSAPEGGIATPTSIKTDAAGQAVVSFTAPNAPMPWSVRAAVSSGLFGEVIWEEGLASRTIETARVSVDADGNQGMDNNESYRGSRDIDISSDGDWAVFLSGNSLVPTDTNGAEGGGQDWYLRNLETGAVQLVSVASDGSLSDDYNGYTPDSASVSNGGRYVAFDSYSTNLAVEDYNNKTDVFYRDTLEGTTIRVSVDNEGIEGNRGSRSPSISDDGRYVAFVTGVAFDPADENGTIDIYRRDMQEGTFQRVSVGPDGADPNANSDDPAISGDGRYVTFMSAADNLVPNDTNEYNDIFVFDCQTGTTSRVCVGLDGAQADDDSQDPSISGDGRYIAFSSDAENLVDVADAGNSDIFVFDRETSETICASLNDGSDPDYDTGNDGSYSPSIDSSGTAVAFQTGADNLIADDTNGDEDIYVYDLTYGSTSIVSVTSERELGDNDTYHPSISGDGLVVGYESDATNLVEDDTNNKRDVFVSELEPATPPDSLPPVITVTGVTDGTLYLHPVTVGWTVEDDSAVESEAELNGEPFDTGTRITKPGRYLLGVYAVDEFGNESEKWVAFRVAEVAARIDGASRAGIAGGAADERFGDDWGAVRKIVLVNGELPHTPDVIVAAGLGGALRAPVLHTYGGTLPGATSGILEKIGEAGFVSETAAQTPIRVYLVGGAESTPDSLKTKVKALLGADTTFVRVGGTNRYDTAAAVARRIKSDTGHNPARVLIANGSDYAKFYDAAALSAIAGAKGYPILYVGWKSTPTVTTKAIADIGKPPAIIAGGTRVVSASVFALVDSANSGRDTARWSGFMPGDTAIVIAGKARAARWLPGAAVTIASRASEGAAGAGALGGATGAPLLWTKPMSLSNNTRAYIIKTHPKRAFILGPPTAVGPSVKSAVKNLID